MREGAEAVAVGVTPEVSKALTLGLVVETVDDIVSEREVLGFPPSKRFLSATGSKEVVDSLAEALENSSLVRVLGISQAAASSTQPDFRLVASFSYASGPQVASLMKEFLAGLGAKQVRTNSKSGRSLRPLSVKFDDPRVI
jgi:precorrin-6x reductase